jgi:hypothetical protein
MRTRDDLHGTSGPAGHPADGHTCPVQHAALAIGIAFLVAGIAGFIPGVTTDYDTMELSGPGSKAELFGLFQVSILHNLVHIVFGAIGVIAARRAASSRWYLVGGGLVYLALFVYGIVIDKADDVNVLPVNDADDWLHLGLGLVMIVLGAALWQHRRDTRRRATDVDGSV